MEAVGLFLYLLQQLGMTLGVGASTFALTFYILAMRDGTVDDSERRFMNAVYLVLRIGLFLIILSGAAITAAHVLAGEVAVLSAPAFLFKWALLGIILLNGVLMSLRAMPMMIGAPIAGASWYALFVLHNTAPETGWGTLISLYAGFLIVTGIGLELARRMSRGRLDKMLPANAPLTVRYDTPTVPVVTAPRPVQAPVSHPAPRSRILEERIIPKPAAPQRPPAMLHSMPRPAGSSPVSRPVPPTAPVRITVPPQARPVETKPGAAASVDFRLPQDAQRPPQQQNPHP